MDPKKYRLISILVLVIGVVFLIAGAVMLGIGISKYNGASKYRTGFILNIYILSNCV